MFRCNTFFVNMFVYSHVNFLNSLLAFVVYFKTSFMTGFIIYAVLQHSHKLT